MSPFKLTLMKVSLLLLFRGPKSLISYPFKTRRAPFFFVYNVIFMLSLMLYGNPSAGDKNAS